MKSRHSQTPGTRICITVAMIACLATPAAIWAGPWDGTPGGGNGKSPDKRDVKAVSVKRTKKREKSKSESGKVAVRTKHRQYRSRALPSNERREQKYLRDLGEGFKIAHTRHYTVFYNTPDEDVKAFSMAIEKIYTQVGRYVHKMGIQVKEPKYKLITHYFDTFEQYGIHANRIGHGPVREGKLGFYVPVSHLSDRLDPGENMTYFYNVRNTPWFRAAKRRAERLQKQLRDRNLRGQLTPGERRAMEEAAKEAQFILNRIKNMGDAMTESTLQHEVSHQVLFNTGFHNLSNSWANPRWLAEGMAQLFETPSNGKQWGMALVNKEKLKEFRRLEQHDALVPVRSFVSDPRWFFRSDAGALAYPQSWAMLHYISRNHRGKLKAYVELLNARPADYRTTPEKELDTFEKAFGPLDEKWEQRWLRWMKRVRA